MRTRPIRTALVLAALVAIAALILAVGHGTPPARSADGTDGDTGGAHAWNVLDDPIDPRELTDLQFCDRSYWLQPWRAYLDTPPASVLSSALGINFNVPPVPAPAVARLLQRSGFHHARLEEGWGAMSYAQPSELAAPAAFVYELRALRSHGIRPLILLNANQQAPGPMRPVSLGLAAAAPAGARTVRLTRSSASSVVPGLTGFSDLKGYSTAAQDIITSVAADGTASLSEPLPVALAAGLHAGDTLRYEPFAPPRTPTGTTNAAFAHTLSGWLLYVAAVTRTARAALGGDNFDVEVWNELNFGSSFLAASNYYAPVPTALRGGGDTETAILTATLAWLRAPAHGMLGVGVTDGFASQTPFATGAGETGLTALSKHPYTGALTDFGSAASGVRACRPLNALGEPEGMFLAADDLWRDDYTPSFVDYFPEYYLSAIQTETLVRDLAPITTTVQGLPHGRDHEPAIWVTEQNIDPSMAHLDNAAAEHMQAKATLRTLVSFVNLGVAQLDFYAVTGPDFGLVDAPTFERTNGARGGPTIAALQRLFADIGPTEVTRPRALSLQSIAQWGDAAQFQGDGTAGHPPLYNRDVLGVFPFQVTNRAFVIAAYVMTRDIAEVYDASSPPSDLGRYDLPPEAYRLQIGGVDGDAATVSADDPLSGASVPAAIVDRTATSVTVQVELTDSPRLLRVTD